MSSQNDLAAAIERTVEEYLHGLLADGFDDDEIMVALEQKFGLMRLAVWASRRERALDKAALRSEWTAS